MGMQGFINEAADVVGVTTAYDWNQKFTLGENTSRDSQARKHPMSGYFATLTIILDETAAGPATTVSVKLFWDSDGDDPFSIEYEAKPLENGMTDTSLRHAVIPIDRQYTAPASHMASGNRKVYGVAKVDAGTVTIKKIRLDWRDAA